MVEYTVSKLLRIAAATAPNRIAATLDEEAVTFRDCDRKAARLAHALTNWGVRRQHRVVYWADISLRTIDLYFALSHVGAIFVPVNPALSLPELHAVIDYLEPHFIVAGAGHAAAAESVARRAGVPLGVLGGGRSCPGHDLDDAASRASDGAAPDCASSADIQVMFLTSGSTGRPKAVRISQKAQWMRCASSPSYTEVGGGRGTANMFPLFHMAGWHMTVQSVARRRAVHLVQRASSEALWQVIEAHQPQELYAIPAVWRRLLDGGAGRDGRCLVHAFTGTSRVEPELVDAILQRFQGARTGVYYGSTELGNAIGIGHDDLLDHPYSVGIPLPGVEARIEDGELLLRSETMMDGYHALPEETAAALQGGWYHTGDLAEVSPDGFFEIVGRRREIIRSGGESIAPAEVEAALRTLPDVADVAVVGLPHEGWGEVVCAVFVMQAGKETPSIEALRGALADRLASFKHPRIVRAASGPLPRTLATGQIQRSQIRQALIAQG